MSEMTASSVHDAGDVEGQRLLEAEEYSTLVESHDGAIVHRCQARMRYDDPIDVAPDIGRCLLDRARFDFLPRAMRSRLYGLGLTAGPEIA